VGLFTGDAPAATPTIRLLGDLGKFPCAVEKPGTHQQHYDVWQSQIADCRVQMRRIRQMGRLSGDPQDKGGAWLSKPHVRPTHTTSCPIFNFTT